MRIVPPRAGAGGHRVSAEPEGGAAPWPPPSHRARVTVGVGTVATVLLASACWYPKEMGERLEQRIDRVETTSVAREPDDGGVATQELARRVDLRISVLQKQIEALSAASATSPQGGSDRTARADALAEEIRRLRSTLEQHTQRLDALERSITQPRQAVREKPSRSQVRPAAAPSPPPAAPPEEEVLAIAREQESRGEKAVARSLYEEYLEKYPGDPGAAEARFRLGELAYGERRYRDAIVQYGRVAQDFPRSGRAPDALLQTAESMLAVGLRDDAVTVLNDLPKRYPGTPAAGRARQRLTEIARSGVAGSTR